MKSPESKSRGPSPLSLEELARGSYLVCLARGKERFYFESLVLDEHRAEAEQMLAEGWKIEKATDLPNYLVARRKQIEGQGLVEQGWGWVKPAGR